MKKKKEAEEEKKKKKKKKSVWPYAKFWAAQTAQAHAQKKSRLTLTPLEVNATKKIKITQAHFGSFWTVRADARPMSSAQDLNPHASSSSDGAEEYAGRGSVRTLW